MCITESWANNDITYYAELGLVGYVIVAAIITNCILTSTKQQIRQNKFGILGKVTIMKLGNV